MDVVQRFALTIGGWLGLVLAGKTLGPMSIVSATKLIYQLDDKMRAQTCEDVKAANGIKDGFGESILLVQEFSGFGGKEFLRRQVQRFGGGTAWYQSGHGRMECFWIHLKDFEPRGGQNSEVGYVVHGSNNVKVSERRAQ